MIRALEEAVQDFLEGAMGKLGRKVRPPIPVEDIATDFLGLKVERARLLPGLTGELNIVDRVLSLNRRYSATRQRFTLAHEIGHWVLHIQVTKEMVSCQGVGTGRMEIEANAFAASLLMPRRLVYSVLLEGAHATRPDHALDWVQVALRCSDDRYLHIFNSLLFRLVLGDEAEAPQRRAELLADLVPSLALRFLVSREAMTLRLKRLGFLEGVLP